MTSSSSAHQLTWQAGRLADWEGTKVIDRECSSTRWIKKTTTINESRRGGYRLSHVWDGLLAKSAGEQKKN